MLHARYRCLYGAHQLLSTLYYVTLFQSVFGVYKYYCTSPGPARAGTLLQRGDTTRTAAKAPAKNAM